MIRILHEEILILNPPAVAGGFFILYIYCEIRG